MKEVEAARGIDFSIKRGDVGELALLHFDIINGESRLERGGQGILKDYIKREPLIISLAQLQAYYYYYTCNRVHCFPSSASLKALQLTLPEPIFAV